LPSAEGAWVKAYWEEGVHEKLKQYASPFLKAVAFAYLAFPVIVFPALVVLFNVSWEQVFRLLVSPFFYFLTVWMIVAGFGLWEMRRWGWYVFLGANVWLLYWCAWILAQHARTDHKGGLFMIVFVVLCGLAFRVAREIRVPYFHPRIRWWETNPRYRLSVAVQVKVGDRALKGEILDVSRGGCFIKLREEVKEGEKIDLQFSIFQTQFKCAGTVVWRSKSTVTHPKGCGIKFQAMNREQRKSLRLVEARLKRISSFYRSSRLLMEPAEFSQRMEELYRKSLRSAGRTGSLPKPFDKPFWRDRKS
jgi:hypothetical protein